MIGGQPFLVPAALRDIYDDRHPAIVIRKPSQVGITEFAVNTVLWAADSGYGDRGVALYMLPTNDMAARISQMRVAKAIAESPHLRRRAAAEAGDRRGPANVHCRSIGSGVIYLTGADQETQYSGIDADVVILDEFDLMREEVLSQAQARLRSSQRGLLRITSTPSLPDVGISYLYEQSDQRYYELECATCGLWQEPQHPDSVDWERLRVVCIDCRAELDPWRPGRWVARNPAVTGIRGYQLSRLVLPNPPLYDMKLARDALVPSTVETFYRQDLGLPYVAEESRLTLDTLDAAVRDYSVGRKLRTSVMGIDVGKQLHVVIRGLFRGEWYLQEAFTAADFEELEACFGCYNIACCVVDARPETRAARAFQRRHAYEVWLADYLQNGIEVSWDRRTRVVKAPRSLIMDEMMDRFRTAAFHVPSEYQTIADGAYLRELLALVRVEELDAFGEPVARYSHRRADDFAHAEVYAMLATMRASRQGWCVFPEIGADGSVYLQRQENDFDLQEYA